MKASDGVQSLGHLGQVPQQEAERGSWSLLGLWEDALCPSSGAGLVLKQNLNLIHPLCGRSFKTKAADDADAFSLPTASSLCIGDSALNSLSPKKSGFTLAEPYGCCRSEPMYHSSIMDFSHSSIPIFSLRWLGGCSGGAWEHPCLSLGHQLWVSPLLRG